MALFPAEKKLNVSATVFIARRRINMQEEECKAKEAAESF